MSEQTLTARQLITAIGVIEYPVLTLDADGRITDISSDPSLESTDTLVAGFFDVHTHGAAGHDVMEPSAESFAVVARFLATRGVSHFLPTTVTAPLDATLRSLEHLADRIEAAAHHAPDGRPQAQPLGIHLEGPFVSHGKRGVHPPAHILAPDLAIFDRFWQAARGHIRLMTIAPEEPGALALIEHATALGVRISVGHSMATSQQTLQAIASGAVSATHTFNAMRPLDHREPGILGVTLDNPSLYAELICDGVHVAPEVVRLWFRAKAPDHAILVTDSMAAAGMPEGEYTLGGMAVTVAGGVCLADGVLAGSVLTMDKAVSNLRAMTGTDLATAARLASANPAAMAGFAEMLALREGNFANLNRYNEAGDLLQIYVRGVAIQPEPRGLA